MNERKTLGMMAAPATTSTMPEEVSPASPMKRDRSTKMRGKENEATGE